MKHFFRSYGRYLLYLPIGAVLAMIGFLVGERRAAHTHLHPLPDEVASLHPAIQPGMIVVPRVELPERPVQSLAAAQPAEQPPIRPRAWAGFLILLIPFVIAAVAIAMSSGSHLNTVARQTVLGGDPNRGRQMIAFYGCGSCHTISGIPGASGKVGPEISANLAQRSFIAGKLANNPENMVHWIMDPQGVTPGTDMPNMNVTDQAARDIAAYIYSLR
jgi:cytochrome c